MENQNSCNLTRATNLIIGKAFTFAFDIPVTDNDLVDFNNVGIDSTGVPIQNWYHSKFKHKSRSGPSLYQEVMNDALEEVGIDYGVYNQHRPKGRSKQRYYHIELIPYVLAKCKSMKFSPAFVNDMVQSYKNRNVSHARNITTGLLDHPNMAIIASKTPSQSTSHSRASTPALMQQNAVISQELRKSIPIPYMPLQISDFERRVSISNRETLSTTDFGEMSVSTYLPPNSITMGPRLIQQIVAGVPRVASKVEIEKSLQTASEFSLSATELQLIKADVHRLFGGIQNLALMADVIRCLLTILRCQYSQVLGTRVLVLSCIMPIVEAVDCISRLYSIAGVVNDCRLFNLLMSAAKMSASASFLKESTRRMIVDMNAQRPNWFASSYGIRWAEPLLWQDGVPFLDILHVWTYIFESSNAKGALCSLLLMHAIHIIETSQEDSVINTAVFVQRQASKIPASDMIRFILDIAVSDGFKMMNSHLSNLVLSRSLEDVRLLIGRLGLASEEENDDEGEECQGLEDCANMVEYTCLDCIKRICQSCVNQFHLGHRLGD